MNDVALDGALDLQWARTERRMQELMNWAKLRKGLAASVRRQIKSAANGGGGMDLKNMKLVRGRSK
jgi:hypothetical protein